MSEAKNNLCKKLILTELQNSSIKYASGSLRLVIQCRTFRVYIQSTF
jgi:hypothetical protein